VVEKDFWLFHGARCFRFFKIVFGHFSSYVTDSYLNDIVRGRKGARVHSHNSLGAKLLGIRYFCEQIEGRRNDTKHESETV